MGSCPSDSGLGGSMVWLYLYSVGSCPRTVKMNKRKTNNAVIDINNISEGGCGKFLKGALILIS